MPVRLEFHDQCRIRCLINQSPGAHSRHTKRFTDQGKSHIFFIKNLSDIQIRRHIIDGDRKSQRIIQRIAVRIDVIVRKGSIQRDRDKRSILIDSQVAIGARDVGRSIIDGGDIEGDCSVCRTESILVPDACAD